MLLVVDNAIHNIYALESGSLCLNLVQMLAPLGAVRDCLAGLEKCYFPTLCSRKG